jgi:hypothetical protein
VAEQTGYESSAGTDQEGEGTQPSAGGVNQHTDDLADGSAQSAGIGAEEYTRQGDKDICQGHGAAYADQGEYESPSAHYPRDRAYGDGTVPNGSDGLNPNASAIVATAVTNGMTVAAINPMTDLGRTIYQAMGQELMNTKNWGERYDETEVRAEVKKTGGALIAFGLGDSCSAIGKANAGLESAPYATYAQRRFYSRYILLFRLKTVGAGSVSAVLPEFAGVIDCCGNTIRAAEMMVRSL